MPKSRQSPGAAFANKATIDRTDIFATACLGAVIAVVPFPFGSTDPSVIAVWVLLLSATLALASWQRLSARDVVFLLGFAIAALSWGLIVFEQLNSAPLLAELINPIWRQTAVTTGQGSVGSISIARHQPYLSAGAQIACMLSIACGFLIGRNRYAANLLLMTFAASGLLYAVYGILAFSFWPDHLLWQAKFNYQNSLTGTFFNPNVTAVYFGACTIAWLLILASAVDAASARRRFSWRDLVEVFFIHPSRRITACVIASFTVLSAMLMTGSRAGSIFSLLAISGAAATLYRRQWATRGLILVFPLFATLAVVLAIQLFGGRINQRFGSQGLFDPGRWSTYVSTLKIIEDHPWLGTGLGTFRWAFPTYRSENFSIAGIWEQAHSTTLEIASEMGIPFTVLVIAGWLTVFVILGRGMVLRKRDAILPLAAFWVGWLAVIHSQIDFSLQIPGFSIPVCTLVGLGLAQSASSRRLNQNLKPAA